MLERLVRRQIRFNRILSDHFNKGVKCYKNSPDTVPILKKFDGSEKIAGGALDTSVTSTKTKGKNRC